jgi:antitoxin VapB
MGMNIKNPEAHALAREIAAKTGLSLTDAVLAALRDKRAALAGEGREAALAETLLAYGRRAARRRRSPVSAELRHRRPPRRPRPAGMIVDRSAVWRSSWGRHAAMLRSCAATASAMSG